MRGDSIIYSFGKKLVFKRVVVEKLGRAAKERKRCMKVVANSDVVFNDGYCITA